MFAQHGAQQFSLCCRHSVVSPPSPHLHESFSTPYTDAPTALCGGVSGKHWTRMVRPNCALIASTSAVRRCLWQALDSHGQTKLRPDCVHFSCAAVSLPSIRLAWSDQTAPWLRPLQLLLPESLTASSSACCSSSASACYHTHAVQILISTKVACHYCSSSPWTYHFWYAQTFKS